MINNRVLVTQHGYFQLVPPSWLNQFIIAGFINKTELLVPVSSHWSWQLCFCSACALFLWPLVNAACSFTQRSVTPTIQPLPPDYYIVNFPSKIWDSIVCLCLKKTDIVGCYRMSESLCNLCPLDSGEMSWDKKKNLQICGLHNSTSVQIKPDRRSNQLI